MRNTNSGWFGILLFPGGRIMEQTPYSGISAGISSASLPAMPGTEQPAEREGWGY